MPNPIPSIIPAASPEYLLASAYFAKAYGEAVIAAVEANNLPAALPAIMADAVKALTLAGVPNAAAAANFGL